MPLTQLDPVTALIAVDLQAGIVGAVPAEALERVIDNNRRLLNGFRARALPVVIVTCDAVAPGRTEMPPRMPATLPAGFADPLPDLDRQPDDLLVVKKSWGAFATTDLDVQLRALDVTQVVVTGIATGTGVEATARQAYEAGFNVTLAIDAMADPRQEAHDHSIARIFPRLGERGSTNDVLTLFDRRG